MFNVMAMLLAVGCSTESPELEIEEGEVYAEGIVSEDPPGYGDWEESEKTEDTESPIVEEETMTESYAGCSNEIQMWSEPDPLNHPCNFRLLDQNGNFVELYDFEGDVILLDFSTAWCIVCKRVAENTQDMHEEYDPFTLITVLTQDSTGGPGTVELASDWAAQYGITTAPVLAGDDSMVGTAVDQWNIVAVPTFFLIDKDFHLRILQPGWNEETITSYVEDLLAE
tara:strand:+ start:724 stop:1401 length:678 start_codon:yes stop_codon:yes gene_type:complete